MPRRLMNIDWRTIMSDKNINDNDKPEELADRDLDQAGGCNFEEIKVTYVKDNDGIPNRMPGTGGFKSQIDG